MSEIGAGEQPTPTRLELRAFSKAKDDEVRQHAFARRDQFKRLATADRIKQARASATSRRQEITTQKRHLVNKRETLHEHNEEVSVLTDTLAVLERQLSDQQTQLTKRIMAYFRPQVQESVIGELEERIYKVRGQYNVANATRNMELHFYENLKTQLQEDEDRYEWYRHQPQEILDKFYADTLRTYKIDRKKQQDREELEEYKKEHGGIENVVRENNVYFVHATNPLIRKGWGNNPFLRDGIDWTEKVACVLGKKPKLSASSIRPGSSAQTWAPIGIILNGGMIDDAGAGDKATVVLDSGDRVTSDPPWNIEDYNQRISWAVQSDREKYNEYIVDEPQSVGLFINLDDVREGEAVGGRKVDPDTIYQTTHFSVGVEQFAYADIFHTAVEFEMPVFVFDNGVAYEAALDPLTKSIVRGNEVSPQEMVDREYIPPENPLISEMAHQALRPEALV